MQNSLLALSPLDGRYHTKISELTTYFSEYALIRNRVRVEIAWLITLSECPEITDIPSLSNTAKKKLDDIIDAFDVEQAVIVKNHESSTNHDVKAVEYYLKEAVSDNEELKKISEFIHFSCTSEDINNLSYALSILESRAVINQQLSTITGTLRLMSHALAGTSMLAKTHGQPASPTTMGKELANLLFRIEKQINQLNEIDIYGKFNGATGNFNSHFCAYPEVDWEKVSAQFVQSMHLTWNAYTTQIEPHDYYAEYFHNLMRINTILIDLSRDMWGYISFGLFKQKVIANEIGSSAMPHKVNPIDFENAEGNLGLSNALLAHMADKLPVSRFQRDLSDSTVQRNIGSAIAYALIAWKALAKGLTKLEINSKQIQNELDANPEVLAEAVQTVMRRYGIEKPYEKLKHLTRGKQFDKQAFKVFIQNLEIPKEAKQRLLSLKPEGYIGNATDKARSI